MFTPAKCAARHLAPLLLLAAAVAAQTDRPLAGSLHPSRLRAVDRGPADPTVKLSRITLFYRRTPEQHAALDVLLADLQDPTSPNYHKWLTPEQFADRFGAPPDLTDRLRTWLESRGLTIEDSAHGRGFLVFSGTIAHIQTAFQTEIHGYYLNGQRHFAAARPPIIPAEFASSVSALRGLDDFRWHSSSHVRPAYATADGSHYLAPIDAAGIYGFLTVGGNGKGQNIAVAGQASLKLSDVQLFRKTFSLTAPDPQTVLIGNDRGFSNQDDEIEAEADVQWAGVADPGSQIIYVYAADVRDAVAAAIDRNLAPVLSLSFGECEQSEPADEVTALRDLAQQANAQGITWAAASGDAGAASCDDNPSNPPLVASHGPAVHFPASLPEVTSVGGTEFNEGAGSYWAGGYAAEYIPEVVWNDTSPSAGIMAGGGGASILFPKPVWQTGPGVPADSARDVPDLSFNSSENHDGYIVILNGSGYAIGGTSLSTPLFAGIVSLFNQRFANSNGLSTGLGNLNPALYLAAQSNPSPFHDVTSGNNIVPCLAAAPGCQNGSFGYAALPGYDLASGLGSLNVGAFLATARFPTSTTFQLSVKSVMTGAAVPYQIAVRPLYPESIPAALLPTGEPYLFRSDQPSLLYGGAVMGSGGDFSGSFTPPGASDVPLTFSYSAFFPGDRAFASSTSAPVPITVLPLPPGPPTPYYPSDQSTGVPPGAAIGINTNGHTCDLYVGTVSPPPFWGTTLCSNLAFGNLAPSTKYYWRVVLSNVSGSASSSVFSFTTANQSTYLSYTVAGNGQLADSGDGGPATAAGLERPTDIAVDSAGTLYMASADHPWIRSVNPNGVIYTFAGAGSSTNSGDGGPAYSAGLVSPSGLAVDSLGNLYVAAGNRIRRIATDSSHTITTIAGSDSPGYAGDGGPAIAALLNQPQGIAFDAADNLYIADGGNRCIRKIAAGVISRVAGVCGSTSYAQTDNVPATQSQLYGPIGITVDAAGSLYVVDSAAGLIRKISGGLISTIAGNGAPLSNYYYFFTPPYLSTPATSVSLPGLRRVAVNSNGEVFATFLLGNSGAYVVYRIFGQISPIAGTQTTISASFQDGSPATSNPVQSSWGIAVGSNGAIYFADTLLNAVRLLKPQARPVAPFISPGGIINAASLAPGAVAPGSIASVFGSFGVTTPAQAATVPLPLTLGAASLQFQTGAYLAAPLFYAGPNQLNIQIPWEVAGSTIAAVTPFSNGLAGASQSIQFAAYAPGIFTITDANYRPINSSNPTSAGSLIQIFCTGLGPVTNQPPTGAPASVTTVSNTTATPTVAIGGVAAPILFSGLAPGSVGEYQVDAHMPANVPAGNAVPVILTIGGVSSNIATIAIR
jgi:uncharacterized protein (TIGR03437 family)